MSCIEDARRGAALLSYTIQPPITNPRLITGRLGEGPQGAVQQPGLHPSPPSLPCCVFLSALYCPPGEVKGLKAQCNSLADAAQAEKFELLAAKQENDRLNDQIVQVSG